MIAITAIYGPLIASVVFAIIAFRWSPKEATLFTLRVSIIDISIPITNKIMIRAILVFASFGCLFSYLGMDFSRFFPDRYEMEVFYDEAGIRDRLSAFSDSELAKIGYSDANFALAKIYYQDLDKTLKEMLDFDEFFSLSDRTVHSRGETSFKIEKRTGFHTYVIRESKGELIHTLERPHSESISFISFFEKLETAHNYLHLSFSEIVFKHQVILQPRFKQIIAENYRSQGVVFDHTLAGVTKVYLLPTPHFDTTIYFAEIEGKGLVPVAYAEYDF